MLNITITGDDRLSARFEAMPAKLVQALSRKMYLLTGMLRDYVIEDKLSGQVLNKRTGALQQSIQRDVETGASSVVGEVFSAGDVKYAAVHEFGATFKRAVTVAWGKPVKNPRDATFNYPERSFLRSSLGDKHDEVVQGLTDAVGEGSQ